MPILFQEIGIASLFINFFSIFYLRPCFTSTKSIFMSFDLVSYY